MNVQLIAEKRVVETDRDIERNNKDTAEQRTATLEEDISRT
jgi:hypothetical protein